TLTFPGLAAGAAASAVFAVTADAVLPPAVVIDNTACATTAGGLSACANAATPPVLATDTTLAVTPSAVAITGGIAHPGDALQYSLVVPNTENATLAALVATLTLDPHETLVAGSVSTDHGTVTTGNAPNDATVVVAIGDLPAGQVATITFACRIDPGLPDGTTILSAQAQTTGANIPADASDDPTTPQVDDPTAVQVTVTQAPPQAIPTLGGWGLIVLTLGLAGAAVTVQRRRAPRPFVP
ncbi:MAG TPA: IPTL-CTERM sorting domain-containing protein, partial [Thermoanaerobaculia bacterium]|nr:IPTL-CTERM sorting domain-containing protein [Thermoanaerobaculia bacterium]